MKTLSRIHASPLPLLLLLLCAGGCGLSSQERIDRASQALGVIEEVSVTLGTQMAAIRVGIEEIQATLADPNLAAQSKAQLQAALAKGDEELARLEGQKGKVDETVAKLKAVIAAGPDSGADVSDELRLIGQGLLASSAAMPGEIGLWLKIAGGALVTLSTLLAGWSTKKLATVKTALTEVVAGGEKFKDQAVGTPSADPVDVWKAAQSAAQKHDSTRQLVALARTQVR